MVKSCKVQYKVAGNAFYVKASNLDYEGWKVNPCICRENNNMLQIPMRVVMYLKEKLLWSPFREMDRASASAAFGDVPRNVVHPHEESIGELCQCPFDH